VTTDLRVSDALAVLWDVAGGTALALMATAVSVGGGIALFRTTTLLGRWTMMLIDRF
jgi:hypothetical protein